MPRFARFASALMLQVCCAMGLLSLAHGQLNSAPTIRNQDAVSMLPGTRWTPAMLRREAQRWFESGRQSPDQHSAAWHLFGAFQQLGRVPLVRRANSVADASPVATSGNWQFAGPLPLNSSGSTEGGVPTQDYGYVSGRVSALALDPADQTGNTLWVGAADGGVWKCAHVLSSASCTPMTDGQPTLATGAIAINPTSGAIYVGTGEADCCSDTYYGEGILTSTNGGASWTLATTADNGAENFFGLAFSRILVDPANPQIVIAAAQDARTPFNGGGTPGGLGGVVSDWRGIYRSTDGGATWSLTFPTTSGGDADATDVAYDSTCRCYYAAFAANGFFKSTDQGATWNSVGASPFPSGSSVTLNSTNFDVVKLSVRAGTLYSVIADSTGDLSTPSPCGPGQTTGCDTGVQQSTDGGLTWTPIAVPAADSAGNTVMCEVTNFGKDCQGTYDVFLLAPPGGTNLVLGGLDAYAAATVNGMSTTWTDIENSYSHVAGLVHGDNHALVALNSGTWYLGSDGGVWATQNSGSAWSDLNATLGTIQFYTVSADPTLSGVWLSGAQDNGTSKSVAGGTAWNRIFEGDGGFTAINSNNESQYFVEYPGTIYRFDDAASTLSNNASLVVDTNFTKDAEAFYQPYHLLPHDQSTIIMGTCRVWEGPAVTAADGAGWKTLSNDVTGGGSGSGTCQQNGDVIRDVEAASAAANPNVDSVIYAVTTDDHVAVSQNADSATPTWTDASGHGLPQDGTRLHPFSSVAVNPSNPAVAYVSVLGFGDGHVFKTSNYGAAWIDITGNLPDAPANWVIVDPQSTSDVYVATDVGVFVATDGGVSGEVWQQVGSGLPKAGILQMTISTTSPRMLAAATHGRGLWTIAPLVTSNAQTPDFTLSASPVTQTVNSGSNVTLSISTAALNGDTANISLKCTAPASGCSLSPASVSPGASSTLTVSASALVTGSNTVTVSATDGTNTHTASASVTVSSGSGGGTSGALSGDVAAFAGGGATAPTTTPETFKQALLAGPGGLASGSTGGFVLDDQGSQVEIVNPVAGTIALFAGCGKSSCSTGPSTTPAAATSVSLWSSGSGGATALATDSSGNLYIADNANGHVDKVDATGNISVVVGCGLYVFGSPCGSYPGTTPMPALSAMFESVSGIALDSAGNMYLSDSVANSVYKVTAGTMQIQLIAGGGFSSPSSSPQAATSVSLGNPNALAVDGSGDLFIGTTLINNQFVSKVNLSTGQLVVWAGNGSSYGNAATTTAQSATGVGMFPTALTTDVSGNLYIASQVSGANIVMKVDTSDNLVLLAGGGNATPSYTLQAATGVNILPDGLVLDPEGNLYISDDANNYILVMPTNGAIAPDFSITATPPTQSVLASANATLTVSTSAINGDTASVALSCTSPASGCSFSPASVAPGASSTLTVSGGALAVGSNTISIQGSDGTNRHTASAIVSVTAAVPDFTISLTPASASIPAAVNATITVATAAVNGDSATISLQCTQPATGCSFSPSAVGPGASSTLTVSASALTTGSNTITVSATDGTNTHTSSTVITVAAASDFSLSASPSSASVSAGQSATYTITATPSNGFNAAIAFACSGTPSKASCSFSPASVTPSGGNVTTTMTITTTAASAASVPTGPTASAAPSSGASTHGRWPFLPVAFGMLPAFLLLRGRKRGLYRWLAIGGIGFLLMLVPSCSGGGGGATGGGGGQTIPGTPSGTSTITLTGTSGSLSHTTTVTLVVN